MCWRTDAICNSKGQATVEAAFALPVLFVLVLMLIQPGIILYDRMVMAGAASEGCRLLATSGNASGIDEERCRNLIKRHLGAIPPQDLFHVHAGGCSWDITLSGGEHSDFASVEIRNRIKLLPLLDAGGTLAGIADAEGYLTITVREEARVQPEWVGDSAQGMDPSAWVHAREREGG